VKRTLVINIARMGDLIQSSPLITGLKSASEDTEITLLYSEYFGDVASSIPGVDRLIGISLHKIVEPLIRSNGGIRTAYRQLKDLTDEIRSHNFDRIINITHTYYSAVITALARSRDSIGMTMDNEGNKVVNGDWANYYFNSCLNRVFNRFNLVDMHCRIGGVEPNRKLHLNVYPEARSRADSLIRKYRRAGHKLVALVPGASTLEKAWQPQLFAEAVREIGRRISITPLILGSGSELDLGNHLKRMIPDAVNLCGQTDFHLLTALVERCNLMITNDTGPMHVAAAVGTRVLDISLGSALSHETAPYGEGHIVVEPRIDCYPCHVKMQCQHRSCHALIPHSVIAELAYSLLKDDVPKRLPDDPGHSELNVLQTSFDEDGWLELTPLLKKPLKVTELYNQALREMWKRALSDKPSYTDDYKVIAEKWGRKLRNSFLIADQALCTPSISTPLSDIASLSATGLAASRELASLSDTDSRIDRITQLGVILKQVDRDLIRIAYEHPEIKPLVAQFTYGKDNLTGWHLTSLANQTSLLYSNLLDWSEALAMWITAIYEGVKSAPAARSALDEVAV